MTTNIKKLRGDFPIFHTKPDWAYLDTAATAQVPQVVLDAVGEYCCAYHASVHRGLYREALRATEVYERSRATMARFIHARSVNEIIFTSGATASSNMLVYMLEHSHLLRPGDEIVTSVMEHHSVLVPLQELVRRKRLKLVYIPIKADLTLDYEQALTCITSRTKIVSVMLASNVLGTVNNVHRLARRAHEVGALMLCDATAGIGHIPVDVVKLGVDFLYFSGHKMCGPTGVGVLYGRSEVLAEMEPGMYGGGMIEDVTLKHATWTRAPARFEAGTPNVAGVIGLAAAVEYLLGHDLESVHIYVSALLVRAQEALREMGTVKLFSAPADKNIGILSFVVTGVHPHDMAEIAGRQNVALRAGHHCALPLHKELGVSATVRASFYLYNTIQDVDKLVDAVREARRVFGVQ